jgi:two-component system nitrate/nitrite response regulator NarL
MNKSNRAVTILIVDDHAIFRDGLTRLLATQKEFEVVGEMLNGAGIVESVKKLHPDILLLDLLMPKVTGMDALRSLAAAKINVQTILLSGAVEGEDISRALELGARGLVLKDSASSLLFKAIRAVMAGQYWIGRQSVASLVSALKHYRQSSEKAKPANYGLTPREMEVLKLVVSGYTNKEIAKELSISEQTVKHHITNIFDKLGVYSRLELTLFAFHHGLVEK